MSYVLSRTTLFTHIWDIPALIIVIAAIVLFVVKNRKENREIKDLEDELSEDLTEETVKM